MRMKALLALLGLGLVLLLVAGCSDSNDNNVTLRGTITNASTNLPESGARVTLFRNGVQVGQSFTTGTNGQFRFSNVPKGTNFTIVVTSPTNAFQEVTFGPFDVTGSRSDIIIPVGTGVLGSTLSGTVTNASTGLAESGATVTLLQNGIEVAGKSTTTNAQGQFTITNVMAGNDFALRVSSPTNAFAPVTTEPFSVTGNISGISIVVGSGIGTNTVSGVIGTVQPDVVFSVKLVRNGVVVASTTAGPAVEPTFTFTNVAEGSDYFIIVEDPTGIKTVFGPFTVPAGGITGIRVNARSQAQLIEDGIPTPIPPTNGTATVVAYISGGGTITINGVTSTNYNPTFLTNVTPGMTSITVTPNSGSPLTFSLPIEANDVIVLRPVTQY